MYIAIEGIDTAGKSTQIALLQKAFGNAIVTKEPGATAIGHQIRDIVLNGDIKSSKAEFLLFLADRAEHLERVIKPNLDKMIISDRSVVSGIAYAMVKEDIAIDDILELNHFATDGIYPEKIFLLELSPEELHYRLSQKELDSIELRGVEYLLKIQDALKTAAKVLRTELIVIDAKNSIELISQEIIKHCH
jgi:dTMP kinase